MGPDQSTPLSSPDYLRTSLAAAMVLGFRPGRFYRDIKLGCINLLETYPNGCQASCTYCGLSRSRPGEYADKSFIRVEWPTLATQDIVDRMVKYQQNLKRVCISMVTHQRAYADLVTVARKVIAAVDLPVSALITPTLLDAAKLSELKSIGIDTIGVGLDAADEHTFERNRGRSAGGPHLWAKYWEILTQARERFGPGKVSCHVLVGLGETDRALVDALLRLKEMEVAAHLFSFYPEPESALARRARPSLVRYRRVQLVKHLVEQGVMEKEQIAYDDRGRIAGLALPSQVIEEAVESGRPFVTGGCPSRQGELACTRPFGNSRPGEPFRNFPFHLEPEDVKQVRRELRLSSLVTS